MSELESLDARGLLCPLPVIRIQDRMRTLQAGTELVVTATDPGTMQDIPAWCRVHGHELIAAEKAAEEPGGGLVYRFRIRAGES